MSVACDVYTKLLFKRGHGYPLWEPEPTQSGEVLIGDVGYVLDGGFYRLFNATRAADDPLHERYGVPEGYEPLDLPDILRHHRPHALEAGPICSKSVTAVSADASVEPGTGTFGPLAHIRFKFSDQQGAVLVLKDDAHREVLHPCRDLTQYILLNHAGWHEFARNVCRLDLKSQDIIFVCGWVKTAEWALAAATHRARDGEIAFGGDFGPAGQASFSLSATHEVSMSWEHRRGPKGKGPEGEGEKAPKFDQCVFLHYYKVKHRPFFVPKVLRAATEEEHSSRSSTPHGSDYMEPADRDDAVSKDASFESEEARVEVVPQRSEEDDMLDTMLDYILDKTDATCAIVSDRDFAMFSSNDGEMPDNLSQFLADSRPNLTVTGGVGMLPRHNVRLPPPLVQFVPGPPRDLPDPLARSASATRKRRSRSRSQPAPLAMSPPLLTPTSNKLVVPWYQMPLPVESCSVIPRAQQTRHDPDPLFNTQDPSAHLLSQTPAPAIVSPPPRARKRPRRPDLPKSKDKGKGRWDRIRRTGADKPGDSSSDKKEGEDEEGQDERPAKRARRQSD